MIFFPYIKTDHINPRKAIKFSITRKFTLGKREEKKKVIFKLQTKQN